MSGNEVMIDVVDNGIGLPHENAAGCSSPTSPRVRRAPGSGSRSSARFLKTMAAASSYAMPPSISKARAAPGCDCDSRWNRTMHPRLWQESRNLQTRWVDLMASDILIVDDEADIRDLVAGILQDEGYETRTRARLRRSAHGDEGASSEPCLPRYLAAGQPSRRPAAARPRQIRSIPRCRW